MKSIIETENELYPIFEEIISQAQQTMPHPSGVDFALHRYGEAELLERLMWRSMEVIKKRLNGQG